MDRAYALLTVKSLDGERRVFRGLASTPELDRQGHMLDPAGASFKNPIPLLLFHDPTQPIGTVTLRTAADGVHFEATMPVIEHPGRLKERVDEAWHSIKAGLITGVSIGFRVLDDAVQRLKDGTLKILKSEILEVSIVTIPANAQASILMVKSLAASGPDLPGVTGLPVVRAHKDAPLMTPTTTDQITAFTTTRTTKAAAMVALMNDAAHDNVTLDEKQTKEYDDLGREVKAIDAHLDRLRDLEKLQIIAATPIKPVHETKAASDQRGGSPVIQVKANVPAGTSFVRYVCAALVCKGNLHEAAQYATRWNDSTPEVSLALKAAIAPGNTTDATWAGPLVNQGISSDFIELLRPATILGKIPGLRTVPFGVKVPSQTAGGTYGWVGESKPKPVTKLAFASTSLGISKAAGIIILTEELVRLSNPSAEMLVRADMIAGIAQFLDQQFIDPAVAAVTGVNPASITNGAPTATATLNPLADIMGLISHFATNNIAVDGVTFIMSAANALALSFQTNADGSAMFPGVGLGGGSYRGLTFVTSQAAAGLVIALQPALVLYADDGAVTIDASREASLQMDSAPASPADATTVLVSLWQNNLVGLRAERFVNWAKANTNAVKYLTGAAYPAPTGTAAARTDETPHRK